MKQFLIQYKFHFLLIIIGLVAIALFDFCVQMSSQGIIYPDSTGYLSSAKNLYIYYRGHNYRPILMAVINGLPYLFGSSDSFIYIYSFYVNLICWLASFLVLFEILKEFSKPKFAFGFTVLPIFFIGNMAFVFHLLSETIYLLFMLSAFYFLAKYYKEKLFWQLSLSLSIFILSMLIRPGSKFLAIVFVLYFIKELIKNYKHKFSWFIYGSLFLVFVQCAGLKYQFGNFTLSYIDSVTYYDYIGSKAMCFKEGKKYSQLDNPRGEYIYSNECSEQRKIANEDLKQQLQHNTLNLLKAFISDVVDNATSGNVCIDDCKNVKNRSESQFCKPLLFAISKWQNWIFTTLGFCFAVFYFFKSYRKEKLYSFISFFILYTILLSGISCGQGDRFHVITFPFVLLLLAKFLSDNPRLKLKKLNRSLYYFKNSIVFAF